jgi:hypothetical protein
VIQGRWLPEDRALSFSGGARGSSKLYMGKSNVRVRRLMLVPGALNDEVGNDEEDASTEDAHHTLDWEHHC